jgi:hypothetical protein
MKDKLLSLVDNNPSAHMVQSYSPIGSEFVRPLGTMERFLWLLDHQHPTHFALAAEIEGPQRWRPGVRPLTRCSVATHSSLFVWKRMKMQTCLFAGLLERTYL